MNQPEDDITQVDTVKVPAVVPTEIYGDQVRRPLFPASQEHMNIETGPFQQGMTPPPPPYPGTYPPDISIYPPSPQAPATPSWPGFGATGEPSVTFTAPVAPITPVTPSPFGEQNASPVSFALPSFPYAGTMNAESPGSAAPKQRTKHLWPLAAAIILLLLLLIPGSVAVFYTFAYPATAVVTITPTDKVEQNIFTIIEVTGNADAAQHQVTGARMLIASQSQTQSGVATGQGQINATTATGSVTLENDSTNYYYVTKVGGTIVSKSGVTIVCDQVITVYPGQSGVFQAHAATAGSVGNIPAYDISITQTNNTGTIKVYNTQAFSGGQDARTYPIVQQSDISAVASSLEPTLQQSVQSALQGQLHVSEKMVATPNCTAKVASDKGVGAAVSSFNVTVTETCTGEAYNPVPAQAMAATLLQTQTTGSLDPRYALVNTVTTTVSQVAVSDSKHHTLSMTVAASGRWGYSFNTAQQQALVKLIAGKSQQDAQTLLAQQTGVSAVAITIAGTFLFWNALPTNLDHITVKMNEASAVN